MSIVRGLQGNLTLSYTYITTFALLIAELMGLLMFQHWSPNRAFRAQPDVDTLQPLVQEAAVYLEHDDQTGLQRWLEELSMPVLNFSDAEDWLQVSYNHFPMRDRQTLLVATAADVVLAVTPADSSLAHVTDIGDLPGRLDQTMFREAPSQSGRNAVGFYHDDASVTVVPVVNDDQELLGLLILITDLAKGPPSTLSVLMLIGGSLLLFTFVAAGIGTLFGFFTARRLTERLAHLVEATSAWGRGDFDPSISDETSDEIGQLATHLNQLAVQLQDLLASRESWVATETRHELARELHDSVKQQIFAIRMHLGTAQVLAGPAPEQLLEHVSSAEQLAQQSQQELTHIIEVLRVQDTSPAFLTRLRDTLQQWSAQTAITVEMLLPSTLNLPQPHAHGLLRVMQEALSNIRKHSSATMVHVEITAPTNDLLRVSIRDNGRGFDAHSTAQGFGLQSMRERVKGMNGHFHIESAASGTYILIELPLRR